MSLLCLKFEIKIDLPRRDLRDQTGELDRCSRSQRVAKEVD